MIAEVAVGERQISGRLKTHANGKSQVIADRVDADVAERLSKHAVFGPLSTGAADDLVKATNFARGMVSALGDVSYEEERSPFVGGLVATPRRYSEETAREIDTAVRDILAAAHRQSLAILRRDNERLERGALLLIEKETLSGEDLAGLAATRSLEAVPA